MKPKKRTRYSYKKVILRLSLLTAILISSGAFIYTSYTVITNYYAEKKTDNLTTKTSLGPSVTLIAHASYDPHRKQLVDEAMTVPALDYFTHYIKREPEIDASPVDLTISTSELAKDDQYYLIVTQNGGEIYREEHTGPVTLQIDHCHSKYDYRIYLLNTETTLLTTHLHISRISTSN